MADYTIISDVSNYILKVLREKMCPEPMPSPNNIEVSSPASQDVDYILGLYLYDIREDDTVAPPPTIRRGKLQLVPPPKPYSLYYMVFVNSVLPTQLQSWLETNEPPITLSQAKISLEEKVRVWSAINKPYQISLFYKVAPVFVSSEIVINTPRVVEADFSLHVTGEQPDDRP